jgi:hypothetical protein
MVFPCIRNSADFLQEAEWDGFGQSSLFEIK